MTIKELEGLLYQHKDASFARWQEAYMRHQFAFLGIRQPVRKKLQKDFVKKSRKQDVLALWKKKDREFQYVAIDILLQQKREEEDLLILENLITTKSWWDTVDLLATNLCGKLFKNSPHLIDQTRRWMEGANMWLRRSSLLFQLRYKNETDEALLFEYCRSCAGDPDPFIQRAIAWALREYSKSSPSKVLDFVEKSTFSTLVQREALQHAKQ